MKRFIGLCAIGLLLVSTAGFASETKPIPNTFSLTVIEDDCNIFADMTTVSVIEMINVYTLTLNDNANQFGIITAMLVMDKVIMTYPTINEWLIYKDELNATKLPDNCATKRMKPGWSATNSRK